jgi:hypothetical protein
MKIIILNIFLSAVLFSNSLFAGSITVFEQKNQDGTVEFSDQPSRGAKTIEVNPNVVEVTPTPPSESSPPEDMPKSNSANKEKVEPEVIYIDTDDGTYINNRRTTPKRLGGKQPVRVQPLPARRPAGARFGR